MRTFPKGKTITPKESKFTGVVHEVHLLDGSGSMDMAIDYRTSPRQTRFTVARDGINTDIAASQAAAKSTGIGGNLTVSQFSSRNAYGAGHLTINTSPLHDSVGILDAPNYTERLMNGNTPLNEAIAVTIEKFKKLKKPEDKVLLKIFTDGEENSSSNGWARKQGGEIKLKNLIKDAEDNYGFTITFVGTVNDVNYAIESLGLQRGNTSTHENTGATISSLYTATANASMQYRSSLSKGLDVKKGFYKSLDPKEETKTTKSK